MGRGVKRVYSLKNLSTCMSAIVFILLPQTFGADKYFHSAKIICKYGRIRLVFVANISKYNVNIRNESRLDVVIGV